MGQANLRGTYEERKASAVKRKLRLQLLRSEVKRRRPSPRSKTGILMTILSAFNSPNFEQELRLRKHNVYSR